MSGPAVADDQSAGDRISGQSDSRSDPQVERSHYSILQVDRRRIHVLSALLLALRDHARDQERPHRVAFAIDYAKCFSPRSQLAIGLST